MSQSSLADLYFGQLKHLSTFSYQYPTISVMFAITGSDTSEVDSRRKDGVGAKGTLGE